MAWHALAAMVDSVPQFTPDRAAAQAARTITLQMIEERGRGAVLVGVARVDAALERLLQAVLIASPNRNDALFQADRPLGSFGAKISLAHRLGLIESPVEQALHTLRRVRNAFAHSTTSASLADPAHAGRLAQAYRAAQANPLWAPLQGVLQQTSGPEGQPVDLALRDYILLITILVAFLEASALQLSPRPPAVVMGFGGIRANSSVSADATGTNQNPGSGSQRSESMKMEDNSLSLRTLLAEEGSAQSES